MSKQFQSLPPIFYAIRNDTQLAGEWVRKLLDLPQIDLYATRNYILFFFNIYSQMMEKIFFKCYWKEGMQETHYTSYKQKNS